MLEHKLYLKDTEEEVQIKIDDLDITNLVNKYEISRTGGNDVLNIKLELNPRYKEIIINKKANLKDLLK